MNISHDWSEEEERLLQKLKPHNKLPEIQKAFQKAGFTRSRIALESKAKRMGVFYRGELPTTNPEEIDKYSIALQKILNIKEEYKEDFEHRGIGVIKKSKIVRKILSISDLHIPFDRDDLVFEIIEKEKDADILVINGDFLDLYAVSTWPKERSIILRKEYTIAMEYLKIFSKTFPQVVITRGNHEYRLNRYFHTNVSKDVSFMVNKEILGRLVNGEMYDDEGNICEKNDFSNVHYQPGPEAWFIKIGKTMFLHPNTFLKTEAQTVVKAQEYFMERKNVDCIVIGHTHHQAFVPTRGKLCIEQGCLCCPLDYEKQGKLNFKAMTLGYAVVYQDAEGNCDFNETHTVYLGTQYPIKKDFDEFITDLEKERKN